MAGRILKRTSFGLVRTNPRLTTNVKIVADSSDGIFLESIDANASVSRAVYKGFRLTGGGSYSFDLNRFWGQDGNLVPRDLAYYVAERDASTQVKDRFKSQYDPTYWAGVYSKNSRLYTEEYAAFAPLWLEPDSVPDHFVIFKMDGPVSVNVNDPAIDSVAINKDTDAFLNELVSDPSRFFANCVKPARIVASFDLSTRTALGRYIRGHLADPSFPESPIYFSPSKGNLTYWQGVSYDKGGFTKKAEDVYTDYVLPDKTVTESDDFLTSGFLRNGVSCANLLNIEFLFNDPDQDKYKFARYFGLYCSEAEVGRFFLDGDRLYADKDRETSQLLRPSSNLVGHPENTGDQIQYNAMGVKVYPGLVVSATGPTGVYSGRLVRWEETQAPRFPYVKDVQGRLYSVDATHNWTVTYNMVGGINVQPLDPGTYIPTAYPEALGEYVPGTAANGYPAWYLPGTTSGTANALYFETDATVTAEAPTWVLFHQGNFMAYVQGGGDPPIPWEAVFYAATGGTSTLDVTQLSTTLTDDGYLRLKDRRVNWKTFTGFDGPFSSVDAALASTKGRPGFSFRVLTNPESGDALRVKEVDWTVGASGAVDAYTVIGDTSLPEGTVNGVLYSVKGTTRSIASAMARAINSIQDLVGDHQIFEAVSREDEVIVYTRTTSQNWNRLKWSLFSTSPNFPFDPFNDFVPVIGTTAYVPSPVAYSSPTDGLYYEDNFRGGNDNPYARAVVSRGDVGELVTSGEPLFVKTTNGYGRVEGYSQYLDDPETDSLGRITGFDGYDKYFVLNLVDTSQSFEIGHSKRVSIFRYGKNSNGFLSVFPVKDFDFDFRSTEYARQADSSPAALHAWYASGGTGYTAAPAFDYSQLNAASKELVDSMVGPTSGFVLNGGFKSLEGIVDEFVDNTVTIANEYDRLKENSLPELSLSSRVVPFINKWVYDNLSVDVRENGYRLNTDQSFGYGNFSPAFGQLDRDHRFYTHEWLYLQKYPPYMSFSEKANSFSYFDEELLFPTIPLIGDPLFAEKAAGLTGGTGASSGLLSVAEDYFTSYFTRETVDGVPVPRDFKYSIFAYGSDTKHPETLFRGVKVEVRERSEFGDIDWDKGNLRYLPSPANNGYRFSAVLAFSEDGNQITFVKNDKWKTVTMVVQAEMDSQLLKYVVGGATARFVDRASLYTLEHKLDIYGATATYADRPLSGAVSSWTDDTVEFVVIGGTNSAGVMPNFSEEISLNENGAYGPILVQGATYSFLFEDIYQLTTTTFRCRRITSSTFDFNPITPNGGRSLFPDIYYGMWADTYWLRDGYIADLHGEMTYTGGGFGAYSSLCHSLSFGSLASRVNSGDPSVKYVTVSEAGEIAYNTFAVELVEPEYLMKVTYTKTREVQDRPGDLRNSTRAIGHELVPLPRIEVTEIARPRGGYSPKVVDVFEFCDTAAVKADGLDYLNVEVFTGGTAIGRPFGVVRNMYFNKVNVENPTIILRAQSSTRSDRTVLPDIGEIAIDYGDHFVLRSTWDPHTYRKYLKKDVWVPVIGTREPKEQKAFLASKLISLPPVVRIEVFDGGVATLASIGNLRQAGTTAANVFTVAGNVAGQSVLEVNVLTSMALEQWLINDGFAEEFYKYIDPAYSFGSRGLDDDVKLYIRENVYDRYYVQEVLFFERILSGGATAPPLVTHLDDYQKSLQGYVRSKSFVVKPFSLDGLDFKLIHNPRSDRRTSVAFSVVLSKK